MREAVLPVSLKLFKMPTNCQSREKRIKSKLENKQKKFKSFFSSYKAHCAHQSGRDKACLFNKVLPPPFSWISMPWKKLSFYEYSTSKIETQISFSMNIQKSIKYFNVLIRDWMNSLEGCLPVHHWTAPDQQEVDVFDGGQLIEMLRT